MSADPALMVLNGEVDVHAVRLLTPELNTASGAGRDLMLDLTEVTFIDSTGLGAIVKTQQRLARQGRRLLLVVPDDSPVASLLDLTGLRRHAAVFATRAAATTQR